MKSFTTFIFLIFFTQLFSQELTKEAILGTWKVVDSQIIPEIEMEMGLDDKAKKNLEQLRIGFIGTVFIFDVNNKFTIKYADSIPKSIQLLEFLNDKQWKIEKGVRIAIGTEENAYSLAGIVVKTNQGKKYFILD